MVINHLEKIKGISTKTGLIESLRNYYEKNGDAGMLLLSKIQSNLGTMSLTVPQ